MCAVIVAELSACKCDDEDCDSDEHDDALPSEMSRFRSCISCLIAVNVKLVIML